MTSNFETKMKRIENKNRVLDLIMLPISIMKHKGESGLRPMFVILGGKYDFSALDDLWIKQNSKQPGLQT